VSPLQFWNVPVLVIEWFLDAGRKAIPFNLLQLWEVFVELGFKQNLGTGI